MSMMATMGIDFYHHLVAFGWLCFGLFTCLFILVLIRIEVFNMSNAARIEGVVVQLGKVKDEVVGKIADLEAAVGAGEDLTGPLAALVAAADALDAIVPDVEDAVGGEDTEGDEEGEGDEVEGDDEDVIDPDFGANHPV